LKILYYSSHPNLNLAAPSGYGTHMREMIAAFRAMSHEVLPVIMGGTELNQFGGTTNNGNTGKGILRKITPRKIWESLRDYNLKRFDKFAETTLREAIDKFQPDFIYERANYLQLSGVKAAKELDIPHILEVNSPYVEEREYLSGKSFFLNEANKIERQQLEMTDKVVVVSSALKTHFSERHQIPISKFLITPNAINPNTVKIDAEKAAHIKADYEFKNDETVIGFVGSIFPWHGVDLLIKAFIKLREQNDKIVLLIVGGGSILEDLKTLAKQSSYGGDIIFTGNVAPELVYNYIENMDIAISPNSGWYQSPIKIFEYGALGKAIVAPNKIPLKDVMIDGEDGILSNPNVEDLAKAIERLLNDAELQKTTAKNFQNKVLKNHTWNKNAEMVLNELEKIKKPIHAV